MIEDDDVALTPVNFYALGVQCHFQEYDPKKDLPEKFALPDTSGLCDEYSFAKVYMAWGYQGITVQVNVHQAFHQSNFPNITRGDSVELFFDTRDVKTSGFNTRFCHRFFFLPKDVDGHQAGELTHFRTEDVHELCDPKNLKIEASFKDSFFKGAQYSMKIFIPAQCLHGYDPEQFDRFGFNYRINRVGGGPQHFSATTGDFKIEEQPSLWSSVKLVE